MHRTGRLFWLGLLAALAFSACGSDDSGSSASSTVSSVPTSSASTTAPAADTQPAESTTAATDGPSSVTAYPVEIENCGETYRFDGPPVRIVGMDQISTEMLLHLGAVEAVIGTANQSDPPFETIATEYDSLAVLSANYPTAEALAAAEPDLVVGNLDFLTFTQQAGFGGPFTRADLADRDIAAFALLCQGETESNELLMRRYVELGTILGVADQASAEVTTIEASLAATAAVVEGAELVPTFTYIDGRGPLQTLGDDLTLAGGANILGVDEGGCCPPELPVELVVGRDPHAILITSFGGLDPNAPTAESKQATLEEVLPTTKAVIDDRYLAVDFIAFSTPQRLARDVNVLGRFLHPELEFPSYP